MTAAVGADVNPVWAPDSQSVLFQSDRSGSIAWYWKALAGNSEQEIAPMPNASASSWSADGRHLAFHSSEEGDKSGIWIADVEPSRPPRLGTPQRLVHSGSFETDARFSPDGKWLAFTSRTSGTNEVYVTNLRGERRQWQVSTTDGSTARWRSDGRELYYLTAQGQVAAVSVNSTDTSIELGAPVLLFETGRPSPFGNAETSLGVNGDGTRFLVQREDTAAGPDLLTLVTNWTMVARR
jgi:TolB protein